MTPAIRGDTTKSRRNRAAIATLLVTIAASLTVTGVAAQSREEKQLRDFEAQTGLALIEVPDTSGTYLGKTHRGYEVLFTAQMGDVWGRYFARLAMGELGREVGGVLAFLTRSYEYGSGPAGSILDRLLAEAIGQPLGITIYLSHGKSDVPRLDIVSGSSTIKPDVELYKWERIGFGPGTLYSPSRRFAEGILQDEDLKKRLKKLRGQYIRVDDELVTLLWSGQEQDFSQMIRAHDDYYAMINSIMDVLADIADHVPTAR